MVKITNLTKRELRRRLPTGQYVTFRPGATVEVESKRLLAELTASRAFAVKDEAGNPEVGGGLKTHSRPSKSRGKAAKPKAKPKKEVKSKAKPKKGLKSKKGKAD